MGKLVGTWVLGDTLKPLIYTVKNTDGTNRDLTGATVRLEGRRFSDVNLAIDIGGTVDADQVNNRGRVTFTAIPAGLVLGKSKRQTFESKVKVTQGGLVGWCDPFDILVEVWP